MCPGTGTALSESLGMFRNRSIYYKPCEIPAERLYNSGWIPPVELL